MRNPCCTLLQLLGYTVAAISCGRPVDLNCCFIDGSTPVLLGVIIVVDVWSHSCCAWTFGHTLVVLGPCCFVVVVPVSVPVLQL